jgi:hypothetical protein
MDTTATRLITSRRGIPGSGKQEGDNPGKENKKAIIQGRKKGEARM